MEQQVRDHYHSDHLTDRIFKALGNQGKDMENLVPRDLVPIDQLHTGGAAATRGLIKLADIPAGVQILDAGCGNGGSSRLMAGEYGYRVTGIDLSDEFIHTARALTESVRLTGKVAFHQGSILDMPFEDEAFEAVLCQHVLMNITDKPSAFSEFNRVLKPGGKLLLHEVVCGSNEPAVYPVPWAATPDISYLESWADTDAWIRAAGFGEQAVVDGTENAEKWWGRVKAAAAKKAAPGALGPGLIFGDNASRFGVNMSTNLEEDRINVIEAVFIKN